MRDAAQRQFVSLHAETRHYAIGADRYVRMMSKRLALVDVRDMDLEYRAGAGVESIEDRDRGMGEGGRIDDDGPGRLPGLVDPVDQFVLPVRLMEANFEAELGAKRHAVALDVRQRLVSVEMGLALAERNAHAGTVVVLRGREGPQGMLLLLDPMRGGTRLGRHEQSLLTTVAGLISVALENGQLAEAILAMSVEKAELTRRAFYDPLIARGVERQAAARDDALAEAA